MAGADINLLAEAKNGRLAPRTIEQLCSRLNCSIEELLIRLMDVAKIRAHPGTSGYPVGAAALGVSGAIYIGANVEIDGSDVSQTTHAEQCTVINAYHHGETGIEILAVTAPPCGFCRQFLFELDGASCLKIILAEQKPTDLIELLPAPFGPKNLGVDAGLLSPQNHDLKTGLKKTGELSQLALESARKSYAPYTKAYSGAAVSLKDGTSIGGTYIENAAFNPSISAFKSALCQVFLAGYGLEDISAVHVAQVTSSSIDHIQSAQAIVVYLPGSITFTHELL